MAKAKLTIDIWTDGDEKLPDDLGEALVRHVEHVASQCEQGFTSGEIIQQEDGDEPGFRGWWKIEEGE